MVLKRAFSYFLALTLALNLVSTSLLYAQNTPNTSNNIGTPPNSIMPPGLISEPELEIDQKAFQDLANDLANSTEQTDPGPSLDQFGITKQFLVFEGVKYPMTAFNLPNIVPADFEKDVSISSDLANRKLVFTYAKKGKIIQHEIDGYAGVTGSRDKELYTFLDPTGKIFSIDMGYAKEYAFRSPLPIFEIGSTKKSSNLNMTATYLTRGLEPMPFSKDAVYPQDMPLDSLHTAGDFVLYGDNNGKKEIVALLDRNVIRTKVYTAEAILSWLAYLISPTVQPKNVQSQLISLQSSEEVREGTTQSIPRIDPLVAAVLSNIPKSSVASLSNRAATNKLSSHVLRDKFSDSDWQSSFSKLVDQAELSVRYKSKIQGLYSNLENRDLGENWRALTEASLPVKAKSSLIKALSGRSIKIMASLVAGGAAAFGVDQTVYGGKGTAWAVHIVNQLYDKYLPEVLKDHVYRVTLLKSTICLQAFIPLLYVVGAVSSKMYGGWGAVKTLAAQGMRISSVISLPFFHYIAAASRQPNFMRALQRGLNPFKGIQKDGEKVYPAFNTFKKGDAYNRQVGTNARILENEAAKKAKIKAMAWAFATMAVSEESGYDPATLTYLAQQGGVTGETLEKLTVDPKFQTLWLQSAQEIQNVFMQIASKEGARDLRDLTLEEVSAAYSIAKSKVSEIQNRKGLEKIKGQLAVKWRSLTAAVVPGLASFGVQEAEFLKNAEPSKFVYSQFWKRFIVDYSLCVAQIGIIGTRADFNHPESLAASKDHFLYTTPGHRADMVDQVRVYGVGVPANMALIYQKNAEPIETRYSPAEEILLTGEAKPESYFKGIWEWSKGASNLSEARYADIYQKGFVKSIKTVQAGILFSIVGRVLIGGQSMHDAMPAFLYVMLSGTYRYAWPWAIINRGNQVNGDRAETAESTLMRAKTKLGQGLRIEDDTQTAEGYVDLASLYEKSETNLPPEMEALIPQLKGFIENPSLNDVDRAQEKISNLKDELRSQGTSLLDFSLREPPFPTKAHPLVEWTTTLVGAISTTYLATSLMTDSFQQNANWGDKLEHAGLMAAAFYGGTYLGQKALLKVGDIYQANKMDPETLSGKFNITLKTCSGLLGNLVQRFHTR